MSQSVNEETVTIDGVVVSISPEDKNIVETAKRAGIGIPAPCYFANRKKGCCSACVVDVDGEQQFACGIKAQAGMNITVQRDDLNALRKERLQKYREGVESGNFCACPQDSDCGSEADSDCGTGCC